MNNQVIDLLFVWKGEKGNIKSMETTQPNEEEKVHFGAVLGGLIGYGADGEIGAREGTQAGILAATRKITESSRKIFWR
jgi:hypothetical protein